MKAPWTRMFLSVVLLSVASNAFASSLSEDAISAESDRLKAIYWTLRPAINTAVTHFAETDSGFAHFVRKRSALFPLRVPEKVRVLDLRGNSSLLVLKLESSRLGSGEFFLYPAPGTQLSPEMFRLLLREILEDPNHPDAVNQVIGNVRSHMAHARGANHLPARELCEEFPSVEEATTGGYRSCPICFRASPRVTGYAIEKTLGDACAAQVRQFNPVVPDDELNNRVRLAGERVLSRWIVPLRGYDYEFYASESDQPNAVACPAGKIFVTTGLLAALESENELEAVLAHEIAHVERRHGYRQFRKARTAGLIGGILGAVAGVAVGVKTDDVGTGSATAAVVQAVAGVASGIAISGYARRAEGEADSYALAYLGNSGVGGAESMTSIMEKLKYSDSVNGIHDPEQGLFMSHPHIDDRLSKARGGRVRSFNNARYGGYDANGSLLLEITLEHQTYFDYWSFEEVHVRDNPPGGPDEVTVKPSRNRELQLFASVRATPATGGPVEIVGITLRSSGKDQKLDNEEDTEVSPGETVGMNFILKDPLAMLPSEIEAIKIRVPGIKRWERL